MDCSQLIDRVKRGGPPAGLEVEAHLEGCPACAELVADRGGLAKTLARVPSDQPFDVDICFADLSRALTAERGPRAALASQPTWLRRAELALIIIGVGLLNGLLLARPDLALYPATRMAVSLGLLGTFALAASWIGLRPLHRPPLRRGLFWTLVAAAVVVPLAISILPVAHTDPGSLQGTGGMFVKKTITCLIYGSVFAGPVILGGWLLERRRGAYRVHPPLWAVLAAATLAGNVALQLHCPITEHRHLVLGHATVGLLLGLFAFVASRIPLRARAR